MQINSMSSLINFCKF